MGDKNRWFWTPEEVEVLREHYPKGGSRACRPMLPNGKRVIEAVKEGKMLPQLTQDEVGR